jgi:hypothetical protein
LRHLFASNLVRAGVPITDVAQLLGHATIAMTMRYASHAPANAGSRAVAALERFQAESLAAAKAKAEAEAATRAAEGGASAGAVA